MDQFALVKQTLDIWSD